MTTAPQDEAIARLRRTYEGMKVQVFQDLEGTGLLGMPAGWALVTIFREDGTLKLEAGVSPEGRTHT